MSSIFKTYREKIDDIDCRILSLLGQRFDIVRQVGHLKADQNLKLFQKARIEEVLGNIEKLALKNNLSPERMRFVYMFLIDYAHEIEGHIKEDKQP